ncbi:efflux RND transporter periplasmic adaptor subunit [Paracoccus sp. MC1862]|uniref:efflux RND transporter periplasmic adaptor subunit n=2 Tax=unclassified Paracoccus (in: a-proteobacteria) TaxID=2688777 RepID=UPI001603C4F0|nr:efflux RND transporter periplasmic adaptor subunit [Paracoccus sp. MC1854]MBB1497980.1 efflux RND transporter periplasmic adaptor subunit [Paracoccus sp. MC1862]QQO44363.1 efflux RND transporter periplasmic adaptor subunit [Paracoccus sp. MC1862]
MVVAAFAFAMIAPVPAAAQAPGSGPGAPQDPREVGVTTLQRDTVPVTVTLPGRAVAYQETGIRPQVGGEIVEIAYQPGTSVEAGTVLFRLNDDQLAATLSAAEAAVISAEAAVQGATATVNRYDRLQGSGVSRAELETVQVALANARASLAAAEAERALAQLAVDRTEIRSPIDGVPDIANVSIGDLVTANQGDVLTTVTQIDPIYVDVSDSRARILRNREQRAQGRMVRVEGREAALILETGQVYPEAGRFVAPGREVSPTTGTVPFRLEFPNPHRLILPGQFVRVQMTVGAVEGVLVPQGPTRRSAVGQLTAFVARDSRAVEVVLTEAGTHESNWIVIDGVEAGDLLILDGLTNLNDGDEITTIPVTIDPEGVVREVPGPEATAFQDVPVPVPASGAVAPVPAVAAAPAPRPVGVAN